MVSTKLNLEKVVKNFQHYKKLDFNQKIKEIEKEIEKYKDYSEFDEILKKIDNMVIDLLYDKYYCKILGIPYYNIKNDDVATLKLTILKNLEIN
ncbi:MAG: hypothetical protein QXO12_02885 [Candidatus Pacearchaeota archaeon]